MTELDPGHRYSLLILDGKESQRLQFVKREGPGYLGNVGHYPGTTLQSVLRACRERVFYLQGQKWCIENAFIVAFLSSCLWLLEFRAARRHGRFYWHSARFAGSAPMCPHCGYTVCSERKDE